MMRRMTVLVPRNVGCEAPTVLQTSACTAVPMTTKTAAISILCFIILTRPVLLGGGVGTIKPISSLLLAQVNIVGVEVESDHISLSFERPPPQVCPVVRGEGLQVLIKVTLLLFGGNY